MASILLACVASYEVAQPFIFFDTGYPMKYDPMGLVLISVAFIVSYALFLRTKTQFPYLQVSFVVGWVASGVLSYLFPDWLYAIVPVVVSVSLFFGYRMALKSGAPMAKANVIFSSVLAACMVFFSVWFTTAATVAIAVGFSPPMWASILFIFSFILGKRAIIRA